jgi:hypothetical protein
MTKENPMQELTINQPVTFTNPLDDSEMQGVVESVATDIVTEPDGTTREVAVYVVQIGEGITVRAERGFLTARTGGAS